MGTVSSLTELETFELSAVDKAAIDRTFLRIRKKTDAKENDMSAGLNELVEKVNKQEITKEQAEVIAKMGLPPDQQEAIKAVLKILQASKGSAPSDLMTKLAAMAGYDMPSPEDKPGAPAADMDEKEPDEDDMQKRLSVPGGIEDVTKSISDPATKMVVAALAKSAKEAQAKTAELLQKNAALADKVVKMADEATTATFLKKATTEMQNIPGTAEDKASIMKAASAGLPKADYDRLDAMVKAANGLIAKGGTITIGSDQVDDGGESAEVRIDRLTKAHAEKSGGKVTYAKAYAEVLETPEGARLYRKSLEEKKSNGGK